MTIKIGYDNVLNDSDTNALRSGLFPVPVAHIPFAAIDDEIILSGVQTFTRASDAYYADSDGILQVATTNVPRFEKMSDGVVGTLQEGTSLNSVSATNFRLAASFSAFNGTVTVANDATGVDGVANAAFTITDTHATIAASARPVQIAIPDDSNTHYLSFFILKNQTNIQKVQAWLAGGSAVFPYAFIDSATGALSADSDAGASVAPDIYGDFWRVILPVPNNSTGNTALSLLMFPCARATLNGADDVTLQTAAVFDWPQVELNVAKASSPMLGGATRAKESLKIDNANIPTLANGCTIMIDAAFPTDFAALRLALWASGGGVQTGFRCDSTNGLYSAYIGGVLMTSTVVSDGLVHNFQVKTDGTNHSFWVDGVEEVTDTGALGQPTNDMYIGSQLGTSVHLDDHARNLRIWDRHLTDAESLDAGTQAAVKATSAASGYPVENAYDWLQHDSWMPTALGTDYLTVDAKASRSVDYFALASHTLHKIGGSIQLQWSTDNFVSDINDIGSLHTPADGSVIFESFTSQSAQYWRVKVVTLYGAASIGVLAFGTMLDLAQSAQIGFKPPISDGAKLKTNRALQGTFIGRSTTPIAEDMNVNLKLMTPAFVRSDILPLHEHLKDKAIFISWDEDNYSGEAAYAWVDKTPALPSYSHPTYMRYNLSLKAVTS